MSYTAQDFFDLAFATAQRAAQTQASAIGRAAELISEALAHDGRWWAFGTGHSHLIVEELYGRAGGLVEFHPVLEPSLMLHEGLLKSSVLERRPGLATDLLEVHGLRSGDVVLIASNSGRNAVPVEFAEGCRARGATVIALTSLAHSQSVPSRAPSGAKLYEFADVVIDNCGLPGDAAVTGDLGAVGATSTIVGTLIVQAIMVEVVGRMQALGIPVPIYVSNNV